MIISLMALAGCGPEDPEDAAATVNGRYITWEALRQAQSAWREVNVSDAYAPELARKTLHELIDHELILQAAREGGLVVSDEELRDWLERFKTDFPGRSFEDMFIRQYIDYESWEDGIRNNLLIAKATELELSHDAIIDPVEWQAYLESHLISDPLPNRTLLRHITVATREEADDLLGRIEKEGFDAVAAQIAGGTAPDGVWVFDERLPEPIAKAIDGIPEDGHTQVVEAGTGFSIFLVAARQAPAVPDPEAQKLKLRSDFEELIRARAYARWIAQLRDKADIWIHPDFPAEPPSSDHKQSAKR